MASSIQFLFYCYTSLCDRITVFFIVEALNYKEYSLTLGITLNLRVIPRARELVPCPLALPWVPLQPPSFSMIIWLPQSISVTAQCSCQACNGWHSSSNNKEWQRRGPAEIIHKEPWSSRGVNTKWVETEFDSGLRLFPESNFDRKQCHWCVI